MQLNEMRRIAEAATPGPWEIDGPVNPGPDDTLALHNNDGGAIAYVQPLWDDAEFIATFDPPTVLALLSRLEQAEKNADTYQTLYEQRAESLEQAEQAVARVRELHSVIPVKVNFDEFTTDYCDFCGDQEYPCPTIRALDGDGRG